MNGTRALWVWLEFEHPMSVPISTSVMSHLMCSDRGAKSPGRSSLLSKVRSVFLRTLDGDLMSVLATADRLKRGILDFVCGGHRSWHQSMENYPEAQLIQRNRNRSPLPAGMLQVLMSTCNTFLMIGRSLVFLLQTLIGLLVGGDGVGSNGEEMGTPVICWSSDWWYL